MFLRHRFVASLSAATAAGLFVAAFVPASAAPQPGRAPQSDERAAKSTAPSTPATRAADKRRYCVRYTQTGSRIPTETCKTKAEWWADGVDIDHPEE